MNKFFFYSSNMPTPLSLSIWWNFGSVLGILMFIQIFSGIFLSFSFMNVSFEAFSSTIYQWNEIINGWQFHLIHSCNASFIFLFIFLHISRGIFFKSYFGAPLIWISGSILFILMMLSAFLGYVLPWGQMSYWGATVITNFFSAFPMIGEILMKWIWGNFSISSELLIRFFSLHFLIPLVMLMLILLHVEALHFKGSTNPLKIMSQKSKISFHPYFSGKDWEFLCSVVLISFFFLNCPGALLDCENFNAAQALVTPVEIRPEWYFLSSYAILRCIPSKLGGVISMGLSIGVIFFFLFKKNYYKEKFYCLWGLLFFVSSLVLMKLGHASVTEFSVLFSKVMALSYFFSFFMMMIF